MRHARTRKKRQEERGLCYSIHGAHLDGARTCCGSAGAVQSKVFSHELARPIHANLNIPPTAMRNLGSRKMFAVEISSSC